jgi:hypothetical protein
VTLPYDELSKLESPQIETLLDDEQKRTVSEDPNPVLRRRMRNILHAVREECKALGQERWLDGQVLKRDEAIWRQLKLLGYEQADEPTNWQSFQRTCRFFFSTHWPSVNFNVGPDIPDKSG